MKTIYLLALTLISCSSSNISKGTAFQMKKENVTQKHRIEQLEIQVIDLQRQLKICNENLSHD